MKRFLFALIAVLLCGVAIAEETPSQKLIREIDERAAQLSEMLGKPDPQHWPADALPVGVVGETEAETLYREIAEFSEKILHHSARLKELAETIPDPPPCPDCPECPDCDDDDDDPPPPPPPPVEGVYPLTINGKMWTFKTPPPAGLAVVPHPRFLLPGRMDEMRRKLTDEDHANQRRLAKYRRPHSYEALLYAVEGDQAQGQAAKAWLLALPAKIQTKHAAAGLYHEYLVYDWCHDLFTAAEREQFFQVCCKRIGIVAPDPGSVEFAIVPERFNREKGDGFDPGQWFGNDVSDPSQNMGLLWRGILALAFHGDGVRDEWCEYVFRSMLDSSDNRIYPVYDPVYGGLLDAHNQRALDSGGMQSSWDPAMIMPGYESYFSMYLADFMAAFETATGADLFTDNNYFRLMPHRLAYRYHSGTQLGQERMKQTVAQLTGLYRDSDPEMAALARWLVDQDGFGGYQDFEVFMLGDMSVPAKTPAELGLPLAHTLLGDDICSTRSSLEPDATVVELFTKTLDTHRYEPEVGGLHIIRKGKPLIMRGRGRKGSIESLLTCNINIQPTKDARLEINNQTNIYWSGTRAPSVIASVTEERYRGILPSEDHGTAAFHVFAVDSAKFRAYRDDPNNALSKALLDVKKCKRTVVHLRPNKDGRELIVVYDRLDVNADYGHIWLARFLNEPIAKGNQWTAENGGQQISGTVLSPGMELLVRGGPGQETEGPNGESYNGTAKVFFDEGSQYTALHGEYAVFVRPVTILPNQDYCVVLEVGDTGFTPAAATMADQVVWVDGWRVDFRVEDGTKVSR